MGGKEELTGDDGVFQELAGDLARGNKNTDGSG
jgi:hypothetical protein